MFCCQGRGSTWRIISREVKSDTGTNGLVARQVKDKWWLSTGPAREQCECLRSLHCGWVMFGGAGEGPMVSNSEYSISINRILPLLVLPLFSTRSLCRRIPWLKGFLFAAHGILSQAIYRDIVWFLALGFYGRENGKILRIQGGDNLKKTMFSRCNRADAHMSSQWCDSMHKICTSFMPTKSQD